MKVIEHYNLTSLLIVWPCAFVAAVCQHHDWYLWRLASPLFVINMTIESLLIALLSMTALHLLGFVVSIPFLLNGRGFKGNYFTAQKYVCYFSLLYFLMIIAERGAATWVSLVWHYDNFGYIFSRVFK